MFRVVLSDKTKIGSANVKQSEDTAQKEKENQNTT